MWFTRCGNLGAIGGADGTEHTDEEGQANKWSAHHRFR